MHCKAFCGVVLNDLLLANAEFGNADFNFALSFIVAIYRNCICYKSYFPNFPKSHRQTLVIEMHRMHFDGDFYFD